MTPYRAPSRPTVDALQVERDPFPQVKCQDCGAPTVSMGGETRCARCDLRYVMRSMTIEERRDPYPFSFLEAVILSSERSRARREHR